MKWVRSVNLPACDTTCWVGGLHNSLGIDVNDYFGNFDVDLLKHKISVLPSWEIGRALPLADIIINCHSMQEMGDVQTLFYLELFDKLRKRDSLMFIKNKYKLITETWNFPSTWKEIMTLPDVPRDQVPTFIRIFM